MDGEFGGRYPNGDVMSNFDKLKQLNKPMNLEKEVRSMKKIILRPSSVYGHGLISIDDFEKLIQRVERLELQLKELRIQTGNHDNMDLLK